MLFELLIGGLALNNICKNIDKCTQAYQEEQDEMQAQIDELQNELDELKVKQNS